VKRSQEEVQNDVIAHFRKKGIVPKCQLCNSSTFKFGLVCRLPGRHEAKSFVDVVPVICDDCGWTFFLDDFIL
jgi:hypothetical protein